MKIKGIIVKVGEKPKVIEFENEYKEYRNIVGGNIEHCPLDKNTYFFCNEEGKLIGLDGNRRLDNGDVIAGDFVIVGDDGGESSISLNDDQIEKYMERFDKVENYVVMQNSLFYDIEMEV